MHVDNVTKILKFINSSSTEQLDTNQCSVHGKRVLGTKILNGLSPFHTVCRRKQTPSNIYLANLGSKDQTNYALTPWN